MAEEKTPLKAPKVKTYDVTCETCSQSQVVTALKPFVCQQCRAWNQYPPKKEEEEGKKNKKRGWLS